VPNLGVVGTILCGLAGMAVLDILAELLFTIPASTRTRRHRSLRRGVGAGTSFPLYEAVLWGSCGPRWARCVSS